MENVANQSAYFKAHTLLLMFFWLAILDNFFFICNFSTQRNGKQMFNINSTDG